MNTIPNEESNYQTESSTITNFAPTTRTAKITGILAVGFAVLTIISVFVPLLGAYLFWIFLTLSAALGIFGFLEINSGQGWFTTITWMISLALIMLLVMFALTDSFTQPQSLYLFGVFSVIVPILLTATALISKNLAISKALLPLIIPVFFLISVSFLSSKAPYPALIILPVGWAILGLIIRLESKN